MTNIPFILGRYRLIDRIAIGGMAEVFRAKATGAQGFEKIVALKRILPHLADDREFVEMFIDEAKTVARLNHMNICQIFEFGQANGTYFIALELVEGKDLKRIMELHRRRKKPVPLPYALFIICKTCEALDYAHSASTSDGRPLNIIHRDISPQNVLVSYGGEVKLIDFGIAKAADRLTRTQAGNIKGKFGYMSPEQLQGRGISHRSDLFACGTVLYEILTNRRLFKGENDIATMQMVKRAVIIPPSQLNPELPGAIDAVVMTALERDPDQRYTSAGEMLDKLEGFAATTGNTCSSQQLARWMNEVFAEDRRNDEERIRQAESRTLAEDLVLNAQLAEAPVLSPGELPSTTLPMWRSEQGTSSPEQNVPLPGIEVQGFSPGEQAPHQLAPGRVAGHHVTSGTFSQTEMVQSSAKAWFLVGILSAILILGVSLVVWKWPKGDQVLTQHEGGAQFEARLPASDVHRPPDARVVVDTATTVALTRDLRVGRPPSKRPHHIRKPGGKKKGNGVKRDPGVVTPPPEVDVARGPGFLIVASKPWARVWIDGSDTGRNTPIPLGNPLKLSAGNHRVSLQVNEHTFDFSVTISPGKTTKLVRNLPVTR